MALYLDGVAHALMTLALDGDRITALARFGRPELFEHFELPKNSDALDGSTSATAIKESR